MHDPMVVEICNGGESGTDKISGIGLVVASFAADSIEELTSKSQIRNEIDCIKALASE